MVVNAPVNMPEVVIENDDPFASASDPVIAPPPSYDLWGLVEISAWACHLQKGVGKVPFDKSDPSHQRMTAIDVFIQPLPEIDVKFPKTCEEHWIGEFPTWAKITLPSIKEAGFTNVREINGKWARVTRVDGLDKPYEKKDAAGNPTGEMAVKKTMKFLQFFDSEDECRAAYIANGGQVATAPATAPMDAAEADKQTALAFLKVIVTNAARGQKTLADAKAALNIALSGYPTVSKYFNADSPESIELLAQAGIQ